MLREQKDLGVFDISSRKRIATALKALVSDLQSLEPRITRAEPADKDVVVKIVDDWSKWRLRVFKFERKAFAYTILIQIDGEASEKEVLRWLAETDIDEKLIKRFENDMKSIQELRGKAYGSEKERKYVLFQIHARLQEWHDTLLFEWIPTLDQSFVAVAEAIELAGLMPVEVFTGLPQEIKNDLVRAQICLQSSRQLDSKTPTIYEACAVYLRKALATAIIIRFKRDGKENALKDKDGRPYRLKKLLSLAQGSGYLSSSLVKELKEIKWFGDVGAHDFKIEIKATDIKPLFRLMRLALERLYPITK